MSEKAAQAQESFEGPQKNVEKQLIKVTLKD